GQGSSPPPDSLPSSTMSRRSVPLVVWRSSPHIDYSSPMHHCTSIPCRNGLSSTLARSTSSRPPVAAHVGGGTTSRSTSPGSVRVDPESFSVRRGSLHCSGPGAASSEYS